LRRIFLLFLSVTTIATAARQAFSTSDVWNWQNVQDARISPDGRLVVYRLLRADRTLDHQSSNLRLAATDGSGDRAFTNGPWRDESPCWAPESNSIAWISERGGKWEIRIRLVSDPARETVIPAGDTPRSLSWSPEAKYLSFTARLGTAAAKPAWAPPEILQYLHPGAAERRAIFVVASEGGTPRAITGGDATFASPAWTLDSQSLIAVRGESEIVSVAVANGAVKVLAKDSARFETPLPSPEGRKIAWLATAIRPESYTIRKLWVMNADGSRARTLAGELDRDPESTQWSSDGRTVYFLADDHGATHVYAARNDGSVRQVTKGSERLRGFSLADNGRAVSVRSTATAAEEVASFTVDVASEPVTPAAPNQHLLADRDLAAAEEIDFESGGRTIQAWVVKPPRFDGSRKYPLLVDLQDSPRRMYGGEIDLRSQIVASRGWVVLHVNPRGTPGYGEGFGNLLHSQYPGGDFDDVMRAVDAVVAKGYIDASRMTISGGILAAWAIGHTTRFHSAIARRPIMDWATDVATAEDGTRRATEWIGAMPWEDREQYAQRSPLSYAANFATPTLILAGGSDPGSDQLAFALRQRKVEYTLVRLPESTPSAAVLELETVLAWLGR